MTRPADTKARDSAPDRSAVGPWSAGLPAGLPAELPQPGAFFGAHPAAEHGEQTAAGESAFERNIVRFLAGGFAGFIALAVITTALRDGVSGWETTNVLLVLMLTAGLMAIAATGPPRDEKNPEADAFDHRFRELSDPTRPLTAELDLPPGDGERAGRAAPREEG